MATRPASKLNLQELGIPDEIELVDKQGRTDLASLTQRVDDITPPDNIDISEDGVKVYANYDVNELGWGCEDKTYYFDTAAEFSLGDRTYTKTNAKPAFGGVIGTPGDGQNHAIVLVSTEEDATYFSWNSTAHSFDYNGTTWYYCGGNYAYWGSPAVGISVISDGTLSLEDAARYMLDSAQVYVDDGKFSEIAEPNSGYLFAGGGSQDDYSDATFKVSKEGVVTAQDVEINGESITDRIDNIIDDTTTSDDSTWSSSKITEEIEDKSSVTKTASGNPIEITDGASAPLVKCVTQITGSQDLHGYDKPWVGGAGKNLLQVTTATQTVSGVTFTVNGDGTINTSGTATARIAFPLATNSAETPILNKNVILNGCPSNGSLSTYFLQWYGYEGASASENDIGNGTNAFTPTSTAGSIAIVIQSGINVDNLVFKPMARLATESDPTFTPYSNICPITAYTEGEIEVRGKNLFDGTIYSGVYADAEFTLSETSSTQKESIKLYLTRGTYTVSFMDSANPTKTYRIIRRLIDGGYNSSSVSNITSYTFDVENDGYVGLSFRFEDSSAWTTTARIQIEEGSTPTAYEPYTSTTHTTTYPSAIYRGSEDVVNGEVTSEWAYDDLSGKTWTKVSLQTKDIFYMPISSLVSFPKSTYNVIPNALSGVAVPTKQQADVWNVGEFVFTSTSGTLPFQSLGFIVEKDLYADATAFNAFISGKGIAYEVENPTTSSVTPTNLPIKSLSGYNHIESTTGDMEVEYITEDYQPLVDLIEESGGDSHTYSTTEQVVGKWIDGSDVYEKTLYYAGGQSGAVTFAHGISNFGKLISIEGNCYDNQESMYMPFPRVGPDGNNIGIVAVDSTNVEYAVAGAFSTRVVDVYLTIRYTKTTTQTNSLSLSNGETDQVDDNVLDKDSDTDTEDA